MTNLMQLYQSKYLDLIKKAENLHLMGERIKDMNVDDLKVTIALLYECEEDLHEIREDFELSTITHERG